MYKTPDQLKNGVFDKISYSPENPTTDGDEIQYGAGGGGGYSGGHAGKEFGGGGGSYSKDPNAIFKHQRRFALKVERRFSHGRCVITGPL